MIPDVGQTIAQRYRLVRLIGDGGMGSVFEARHELLGTSVALKFLHPHLARREGVTERFLQEAQLSARIKSPHVVSALDVDRTPDGHAYMVMEYVAGGTLLELYERLRRQGRWLSQAETLDMMLQIFEGVEAAHALGIIHRDLKPANVMIGAEPGGEDAVLKILDFGIAKLKVDDAVDRGLTAPGAMMGTPEYMAPEQALAPEAVDRRADIFSLGVLHYEMSSGRLPVEGDTLWAIADAYRSGRFESLDRVTSVPEALAAAIHQAMAPRPEDRFDSVAALRAAVVAGSRSSGIAPRAPAPPTLLGEPVLREATRMHTPAAPAPPDTRAAEPPPRRHRLVLLAVLVCAAVALVGLAARRPLLRLFESSRVTQARAGALDVPVPSLSSATAAPSASAAPGLGATVGGSWDGWRVRLEYARDRDAAGMTPFALTAERFDDAAWRSASIEQVRVSASYYADHRAVERRDRLARPQQRYASLLRLARDGKYHVDVALETGWGPLRFVCDACIGGGSAACPRMRPACMPSRSSHSH